MVSRGDGAITRPPWVLGFLTGEKVSPGLIRGAAPSPGIICLPTKRWQLTQWSVLPGWAAVLLEGEQVKMPVVT